MKDTIWEGGHRVVGIASWPGTIPPNTVSNTIISALDIVPTFVSLASGVLPSDRQFDGVDLTAVLTKNASLPDRILFHPVTGTGGTSGPGSLDAVRVGKYKFFFQTASSMGCDAAAAGRTVNHTTPLAFDLSADPAESTPVTPPASILAIAQSARIAKLHDIAASLRHVADMRLGPKSASPCCDEASSVCRCSP